MPRSACINFHMERGAVYARRDVTGAAAIARNDQKMTARAGWRRLHHRRADAPKLGDQHTAADHGNGQPPHDPPPHGVAVMRAFDENESHGPPPAPCFNQSSLAAEIDIHSTAPSMPPSTSRDCLHCRQASAIISDRSCSS